MTTVAIVFYIASTKKLDHVSLSIKTFIAVLVCKNKQSKFYLSVLFISESIFATVINYRR